MKNLVSIISVAFSFTIICLLAATTVLSVWGSFRILPIAIRISLSVNLSGMQSEKQKSNFYSQKMENKLKM